MKKKFRKEITLMIECDTENEANQITKTIEKFTDRELNSKDHNYIVKIWECKITNVAEREAYLAIGTK
jgi:hypothetical protein